MGPYVLNFNLYRGAAEGKLHTGTSRTLTRRVVKELTNNAMISIYIEKSGFGGSHDAVTNLLYDEVCNMNRTLTCDNYFTSIPLAHNLMTRGIYLFGTARSGRKVPHILHLLSTLSSNTSTSFRVFLKMPR